MASIRRGYSDDFVLKNGRAGIGSSNPQDTLDVVDGVVKGQDLKTVGVSSFTGYEGFLNSDQTITETVSITGGASLSGEIIVGTGQTVTVTGNLKEDRFGPELITNGQFLSNVDDWTAFNSSNSFNDGRLRITRDGGDGRGTYQLITNLVPGATYFASAIVDSIGSRGDFRIVNGNSWTSNYYLNIAGTNGQVKTLNGSFTATSTTALVGFAIDNNSTVIEVDQVTVRRVNDVEEPGANVAGGSEIECLKVYNTFTPPSGGTNERPYAPKPGELYYNYDFKTIEFFDGYGWRQVDNTTRSGRAVWMGGNQTNTGGGQDDTTTRTDTVIISTLGNAVDFGVLDQSTAQNSAYGSSIEVFSNGFGQSSTQNNFIQFAKFESGGNFEDFGNLTRNVRQSASVNSSTRGCTAGGAGPSNVIDYNELQTKGNSIDFGDLDTSRRVSNCSFSSPTRGVFAGGASPNTATVEFITIASLGNSIKFGDCTYAGGYKASSSNTTRGIQGGGGTDANNRAIEIHIISSGGNASNFGDLTLARSGVMGSASQTRMVFGGGGLAPDSSTRTNAIDYVTISSEGDAIDFGDLTSQRGFGACDSNSHGGLGGF